MSQFTPFGATVNLAVTGTAQSLTVPGNPSTLRVANVGAQVIFVRLDGVTATLAAGLPILPNTVETFDSRGASSISAIAGGTGSTLYVTPGAGE